MQDYHKTHLKTNGRWTKQEHLKFLQGLRIYGKNWKKIQQLIQTRSGSQIRSHAQKFFLKSKGTQGVQQQDLYARGSDMQEQHQSMTENSKSVGETQSRREDMSYYLGKIVEYSTGKTCLDFWFDLVDIKGATQNVQQPQRKNSFTNIQDEEQSNNIERIQQKDIKI